MASAAGEPAAEQQAMIPFEFPLQPYPGQVQLMRALYASCEAGGVALLESPTGDNFTWLHEFSSGLSTRLHFCAGTGKTLSLICSSLQWLMDSRAKLASAAQMGEGEGDGDPDWLREAAQPGGSSTPAETRSVVALARERLAQQAVRSSSVRRAASHR
jgi:chromosome transmission fidelity protein 1